MDDMEKYTGNFQVDTCFTSAGNTDIVKKNNKVTVDYLSIVADELNQ